MNITHPAKAQNSKNNRGR